MEAFDRLSGSRRYTMGSPVNIPLSEILAYLELFRIEHGRDDFVFMIQGMDATYLGWHNDNQRKDKKP